MELDLNGVIAPKELEELATRFREHLAVQLTQDLQEHLNEILGPDIRVGITVKVESVALRKTT